MTKTMNNPMRSAAALSFAACAILLGGCRGHGAYTRAGLEQSEQRLAAIKAGAEFETARQQFLSGELDKSLRTIDTCVALAPRVPKSHTLRGRILLERGDYEDALDAFATAVSLDPKSVEAHFHRGVAFERISRWEDALEQYRAAATLDPSEARFVVAQADMLLEMRRRDEARELLETSMQRFPNSAQVRRSLGSIALLDGLPDLAARLLRESRLLSPDDAGVLEDLARAEMTAGRYAEAEVALNDLLKRPGMDARRDLMHMRVRCLVEMDRLVDARTALLTLTKDREGEADRVAWLTLGRVALKLNDMSRLRAAASRLIALEPTRPDGRLLMAAWQRRRGDLDGALRSIAHALDVAPNTQEAWVMRGIVLSELGRETEAAQARRTAEAMRGSLANVPVGDID
jgi:Flp pilus assembly protein TadD